ncbi:hypothetical protein CU098_011360 [Rhizopus stolonifer]|uniref:Uncharacterized protein n=1 Tax=Rhizopus stolonifer TaxID=4846 RepID=A0A367KIP6_RHIST|nr:hypothetical protein CU098_011360 [Rhizopus stolonifer]
MAKTPYTSAAVTPATVSTPEEFPGYEYFGQEQGNLLQEGYIDEPDIFDNSQYSLHQSLVNELHKSEIWDPLEALYKLKQQSENMVLTQSLHEALAKTAKKQQDESLNISKKKNKTFGFKSSWDDEEYELPSALASGQSSPRTPIFRSMATSELSKEIELEKERYKQQRASLMMVKPQTAIASTLEAELDLSQGTIFKKRHLDHQPSFAPAEINTIIKPRNFSSQSIAGPEDETPTGDQFEFYFDERVIEESKKRLKTLLENREEAIPTLNDDMILPTVCTKKQELFQPELGFLNYEHRPFEFDIKSYKSSFAIDKAYKAFKFQPDLVTEECEPDEVLSLRYTTAVSKNPMAKEERSEEKAPEKEAIVKEIEQESLVNASNSNTIDKEEVNVVTAKQTVATDHIIVVEQDNVQLSPEKKMNNSAHATMIDEAINILNEDKQEQAETISHEEKWVRNKAYGLSGFQETTGDQCDILAERGSADSVLQQQKSIVTNYFGSEVFYAHSTNTKTMTTSPIINRSETTANKSVLDHDPFMSTMQQSPLYTSTTTTSSSTTAVPDKKD